MEKKYTKHKELFKYYQAFTNLYGVISLEDAYNMLFDMGIEYPIEAFKEDIMARKHRDKNIIFIPCEKGYCYIANASLEEKDNNYACLKSILNQQAKQPYFQFESLSSLLKYRSDFYFEKTSFFYRRMLNFIKKYAPEDMQLTPEEALCELDFMCRLSCTYKEIKEMFYDVYNFPKDPDIKKFFRVLLALFDNTTRKWRNGGWTDFELKMLKLISSSRNQTSMIDPELKSRIIEGEVDADQLLDTLRKVDFPSMLKEPIITEIEDIKKQLNKNVA